MDFRHFVTRIANPLGVVALLTSCAPDPNLPTAEMTEAQKAIEQAEKAGARALRNLTTRRHRRPTSRLKMRIDTAITPSRRPKRCGRQMWPHARHRWPAMLRYNALRPRFERAQSPSGLRRAMQRNDCQPNSSEPVELSASASAGWRHQQ